MAAWPRYLRLRTVRRDFPFDVAFRIRAMFARRSGLIAAISLDGPGASELHQPDS